MANQPPIEPSPDAARPYRGMALDERRAQRRAQLIDAAIETYGERGYRASTVKAVCAEAGLTERYFYESFESSEALLMACYHHVNAQLFLQIAEAAEAAGGDPTARGRAMLSAYFSALQAQPRPARVFLMEIRGVSPAVDAAFDEALTQMGAAAAEVIAPGNTAPNPLLQTGVIGGVVHIAMRWIRDGYQPPLAEVVEAALELGLVLTRPAK